MNLNMSMKNNFPIYIVSKGRYKRRYTADMLEEMGLDYYIVVEKQEYEQYKAVCKGKVLILPQKYKDEYDTFWYDDDPRTGPGPARNFAWQHSIDDGFKWHWVLDDNIRDVQRYNYNLKVKCLTSTPFYIMEKFVLRYKNIAIAGPNYCFFCPQATGRRPLYFNTRIYSFLFIRNDLKHRWRGRYNEDTDICLRVLKDSWCTVQFNVFLQGKIATQTIRGGNSAEFYDQEGTYNKSKMLVEMHPVITDLIYQWDRYHHYVNYKPFATNRLIFKDDYKQITEDWDQSVNNYGLKQIKTPQ